MPHGQQFTAVTPRQKGAGPPHTRRKPGRLRRRLRHMWVEPTPGDTELRCRRCGKMHLMHEISPLIWAGILRQTRNRAGFEAALYSCVMNALRKRRKI